MTGFRAETYQNEFLAIGAGEVNAVVTVTAEGDGPAYGAVPTAAEIIIIDVSGSMAHGKIRAAKAATAAAIDCIRDGVPFGIIAGNYRAHQVFPSSGGLVPSSEATRTEAKVQVMLLEASAGTAIGVWLRKAESLFRAEPSTIKHAILLTDGRDEGEKSSDLDAALGHCEGAFQCDCRGVGTDWEVNELRKIASRLLGTVDIVAKPEGLVADFQSMMRAAMGKQFADVALRLWVPKGASLAFVKQVAPSIEDLTGRRVAVSELVGEFPTGAWASGETRDYHICISVPPRAVGEEMLAGRVSLVVNGEVLSQALIRAVWTDDRALSTRINRQVAHYTGQAELAEAIQEGLEARKEGDYESATRRLGRAVQIAAESGNEDTMRLLRGVVDIDDASTGTVRIRRQIDEADELTLDTRSTKTVRVQRGAQ